MLNRVLLKSGLLACALVMGFTGRRGDFPQTEISNGLIRLVAYLPDPQKGYYQATRFDWSGAVKSLEYKSHSYFAEWFDQYDPKIHDAITGPVEEFEPVHYADTTAGGTFIKIGVGELRKADDKPYAFTALYEVVNGGKWTVKTYKDRVEYAQELKTTGGYAYLYQKTLRLVKGKSELVLEHVLKNTGNRKLKTNVYDHNFFVIDGAPAGPDMQITFPFPLKNRDLGAVARADGNTIHYTRRLARSEYVYTVFDPAAEISKYDFRIENLKSGAGVRITADRPLFKTVFWANPAVSCPEPYIAVEADPGKEFKWNITYQFYEIIKP